MKSVDLLAPTYVQMLTALSTWLGKAQAQLSDEVQAERNKLHRLENKARRRAKQSHTSP